ncbi:hypothetical protein CLV85_0918 [Salinibacterium amurskyense]|uniref:Uncharacterized protein n=1 Tax=Salinibacterium amurskyense TaxID=205941 RepID=A0A2M9D7W6_9MICO|nr:hypothetical protein [Salinibacterium amurskyense]PJJ81738.1 hypothetical protein CLV85_0918 [Salinibacterium amurskyense]RLQ83714.1 hypothetical protein D9C83_04550 [Salinibacterium amurskyense]GHD79438.1 hypothetical protein GCM10007394_08990 [Salinibacterium amurskyense]
MTDDELITTFEDDTIAPAAFSHERHVRVAWLLARKYGEADGFARLVVGITSMAVRAGKPDAFHLTMTRAWFDLIALVDDVDAAPELLDKSIIKRFYSPERIAAGRAQWLEPDLNPLQFPLPAAAEVAAAPTS